MRRLLSWGGLPLGVVVALAAAVVQPTWAAFTSTTASSGTRITAGSIALADDDGGVTRTLPNLSYGQTKTWCTKVTYSGTLTGAVRLYASAAGTIPTSISLSVAIGTGGDSACNGFTSSSTLYTGTLGGLAASSGSWSSGLGGFAGATAGMARVYRFTASLNDAAAPAGATASATFTWEAQNS